LQSTHHCTKVFNEDKRAHIIFKIIQDFIKPGGGVIKEREIGGKKTKKQNLKQDIDGEAIPQIQFMEQTAPIISKIA
jgi:hypothetical protein